MDQAATTATQSAADVATHIESTTGAAEAKAPQPKPNCKRKNIALRAIIAVIVVLILAIGGYAGAIYAGVLAMPGAAARYDGWSFIQEQDVTDYIETYQKQMGYEDANDEDWATFLSQYGLTPERLRMTTIRQLVCDALVQKTADKDGITVDNSEVDTMVQNMKKSMAFDDDDTWNNTLEAYGQTEEGLRSTYQQQLLKQKVYNAEVEMPTATDDEVRSYLQTAVTSMSSLTTKHTYCFKISGLDDDGSLKKIGAVQKYRKALIKDGVSTDSFAAYVQSFSDVDSLKEVGGANGWDLDTSEYSSKYAEVLDGLKKGEVSEVFNDGDGYAFIWVDDTYTFPKNSKKIEKLNLSAMPSSLSGYLSSCASYQLWQTDCAEWLQQRADDANINYYDMPSNVPYNVDMNKAQDTSNSDDGDTDSSETEQ